MHSRYRISNSSDAFNLDLGVPAIQKLNSDKQTEEVRLSSTTETLLVEPHYLNVLFTPLTQDILNQEKKRKIKSEVAQLNNNLETIIKVKDEIKETKPISQTKLERLKNLEKKAHKEKDEKRIKDPTASYKKPPNLQGPAALAATKSFPTLPQLPTTPLPQSQLPPDSVRVPPPHLPTTIPAALSSLTPIPLKDLNRPPIQAVSAPLPQNPTPSITASGGLISIQVPLKGADGSTIMQPINVPKSVLAGASDRPVLLTVTPKNGINKGQKQIVMLTKNANGFGISLRTLQPGESPSKVMLSQRPVVNQSASNLQQQPPISQYMSGPNSAVGGGGSRIVVSQQPTQQQLLSSSIGGGMGQTVIKSSGVTDIKALLSQVKPVPTSELANKVGSSLSNPGVITSLAGAMSSVLPSSIATGLPGTSGLSGHKPVQINTSSTQLPGQTRTVYLQQQSQGGQLQTSIPIQVQTTTSQAGTTRQILNRQVIQQLIRPGQLIGNGQQLILQDGKRVILQQTRAPAGSTLDQVQQAAAPTGRIVLTQKGQVLQGAQAQALAGKIINTSQGQFIVGPNGQLLSKQKLLQNNVQGNQTVRYIAISQPSSISQSPSGLQTSQQVMTTGVQNLQVLGSAGGRQVTVVAAPSQSSGQLMQTQLLGLQPGVSVASQMASSQAGLARSTAILVPVGSAAGQKVFTTQARTDQLTTTVASSTPGRVTVAIPIMQGNNSPLLQGKGVQIGQGMGGSPVKLTPGTPTFLTSTGGTTVVLNTLPGTSFPLSGTSRGTVPGVTNIRTQVPGISSVGVSSSIASSVITRLPTSPAGTSGLPPMSTGVVYNLTEGPVGSPNMSANNSAQSPGSNQNNRSTSAFNQMFLNALSNRGLLSQQNGKFVYVGDKTKQQAAPSPGQSVSSQVVSIPVTNIYKPSNIGGTSNQGMYIPASSSSQLGMSANNPPVVSIKPAETAAGDKNVVQVVVSAPNLDSLTASPRLLRMASSLMENPTIAELINTPCENSDATTQNLNGDINLYGVKPFDQLSTVPASIPCDTSSSFSIPVGGFASSAAVTPPKFTKPRTFYYRDPRLPVGWYVGVDVISPTTVITNYYTGNGEKLRSLSEVAHYLVNKLVLLPSCKAIRPPRPISSMPTLAELTPDNRAYVKELILPVVDDVSPVIRQIETDIPTSSMGYNNQTLKRPGAGGQNQVDQKKSKIVIL